MTATSWSIPRESVEYVQFTFSVDGSPTVTGVEAAVTASPARPSVWTAAVEVPGGDPGALGILAGVAPYVLDRGTYVLWARVTDTPEIPVVQVGVLSIT